ncbi:hypothetical protein Tco_1493533 [Tanacetum coccineum]
MDSEVVKSSVTRTEGSSKRTGNELESDKSKKQKIDEHVEAKKDDDQEEPEIKKHMEIVQDDEVAINAIPLAMKPPMIVEYKIDKEENMGYFKLIRADGSLKRMPKEDYERVLWGDLKAMFEPDVESKVWRNLQGYNVTVWKLFSSGGVHFVIFQNMHIFMLGRIVGIKRLQDILRVTAAQLQLLSDYYCWKDYADRDEIKDLSEKR